MARWMADAVGDGGSVTAIDRDTTLLADLASAPQRDGRRRRPHDHGLRVGRASTSSTPGRCSCTSTTPTRCSSISCRPAPGAVVLFEEADGPPAQRGRGRHGPARRRSAPSWCPLAARLDLGPRDWPTGSTRSASSTCTTTCARTCSRGASPGAAFWRQTLADHPSPRHRRRALRRSAAAAVDDRGYDAMLELLEDPRSRSPSPPGTGCRRAGPEAVPAGPPRRQDVAAAGPAAVRTLGSRPSPATSRRTSARRWAASASTSARSAWRLLGPVTGAGTGARPRQLGDPFGGGVEGTSRPVDVDVLRPLGHGARTVTWSPSTWTNPPCTAARSSVPSSCWKRTRPGHDGADQRRVAGHVGGVTAVGAQEDDLHLLLEQGALGGDAGWPGKSPSRTRLLAAGFERAGLLEHGLDSAHVEERLLGDVVEVAVEQRPRTTRPSRRWARSRPSDR